MDLKQYRSKLIGSEDERAVSPVIGVILMVAITVILAAVIAAFVLDMGDSMGDGPVNALVGTDVDNDEGTITVTIENPQEASAFAIRGNNVNNQELSINSAGESIVLVEGSAGSGEIAALTSTEGDLSIVAIDGDSESQVATQSWNFN